MPNDLDIARSLHHAGKLDDAMALYRQILSQDPTNSLARCWFGIALAQTGQNGAAIEALEQAVALAPHEPTFHFNLGCVYLASARDDAAEKTWLKALALAPDYAEAFYELASLYRGRREGKRAIEMYAAALQCAPTNPRYRNDYGVALAELGRWQEAEAAYRRAIELDPQYPEAWNNLGNLHEACGERQKAIACYRIGLTHRPEAPELNTNLANLLIRQGDRAQAIAHYRRAVQQDPRYRSGWIGLADALLESGENDESIAAYRAAVALDPDDDAVILTMVHAMQQAYLWEELDDWTSRLVAGDHAARDSIAGKLPRSPLAWVALPVPVSPQSQLECSRSWAHDIERRVTWQRLAGKAGAADSARPRSARLRIGYLSSDFHEHPVGLLTTQLFEAHSREDFECFGFSLGPDDGSATRRQLRESFDHFIDLASASDREAAQRVRDLEIDLLVDLNGYTRGSRSAILALRPAPIQIQYLGFAATMGASFIDYILADKWVIPPTSTQNFQEQIAYLPGCFMVHDGRREIPGPLPSRRDLALPETAVVYCGFSTPYKLNPFLFKQWLSILRHVPNSVLWLRQSHPAADARLRRWASVEGIAEERLIFAPKVSMAEHLSRLRAADLMLDTFPYNQHSTAAEALRVGLPILTLSGKSFASRVAGSLLHHLDCHEGIADSWDEYREKGLDWGCHAASRQRLRSQLAAKLEVTDLFDGARFAKKLESIYRAIWRRHQSGMAPALIDGSLIEDAGNAGG